MPENERWKYAKDLRIGDKVVMENPRGEIGTIETHGASSHREDGKVLLRFRYVDGREAQIGHTYLNPMDKVKTP